ncbi:MAG: hypothetical protein U0326_42060 [Polyangiales bacterium]
MSQLDEAIAAARRRDHRGPRALRELLANAERGHAEERERVVAMRARLNATLDRRNVVADALSDKVPVDDEALAVCLTFAALPSARRVTPNTSATKSDEPSGLKSAYVMGGADSIPSAHPRSSGSSVSAPRRRRRRDDLAR